MRKSQGVKNAKGSKSSNTSNSTSNTGKQNTQGAANKSQVLKKSTPASPQKPKAQSLSVYDEIFTWAEASFVATKDSAKLSSNKETFVKANQFQYYIALNTWAAVLIPLRDYNKEVIFRNWVRNEGLVSCIAQCATLADELVSAVDAEGYTSLSNGSNYRWRLRGDADTYDVITIINAIISDEVSSDPSSLLQCLRFLKRFTPTNADLLEKATLDSFVGILNETNWRVASAAVSRDPDVSTPLLGVWGKMVKKYLAKILKNFPKYYKEAHGNFSNGVCSDAKCLAEKVAAYSACVPYFDNMLMGINTGIRKYRNARLFLSPTNRDEFSNILTRKGDAKALFVPTVRCVPKNYKAYRTIAPESSYVSFEMQRVRKALVRCVERNGYKRYFDVTKQDPNRVLARLSSIDGAMITVDLSSASDREARHVMRQLLPEEVWDILVPLLPLGIRVGSKTYAPSIFLTSGNPATFMFLGILCLAIGLAARELHWRYTKEFVKAPQIFGDDALVDAKMAEEFFSVLEHLGLKVNYEKTFLQHYRESCGVEYADGYPTITDFWPRKTVIDPRVADYANNITSLTALQQRFVGNLRFSTFLTSVIFMLCPKMTESRIGEESIDLWALYPHRGKIIPAPHRKDEKKPISDVVAESGCMERENHMIVKQTINPLWEKMDPNGREAIEQYFYYLFLAEGPTYPDELSRLLRVSDSTNIGLQAYKPVTELTLKRR